MTLLQRLIGQGETLQYRQRWRVSYLWCSLLERFHNKSTQRRWVACEITDSIGERDLAFSTFRAVPLSIPQQHTTRSAWSDSISVAIHVIRQYFGSMFIARMIHSCSVVIMHKKYMYKQTPVWPETTLLPRQPLVLHTSLPAEQWWRLLLRVLLLALVSCLLHRAPLLISTGSAYSLITTNLWLRVHL